MTVRDIVAICLAAGTAACTGSPTPVRDPAPVADVAQALQVRLHAWLLDARARGERDGLGRRHGAWVFECRNRRDACVAWFEHGVQVQWGMVIERQRWLVDAIDGGWRWQWWQDNTLHAESGLAFEPASWVEDNVVTFPYEPVEAFPYDGHGAERACAGSFWMRNSEGRLEVSGRCERGEWVERIIHGNGERMIRRQQQRIQAGTREVVHESWFDDGTPRHRHVERDGVVVENRQWPRPSPGG